MWLGGWGVSLYDVCRQQQQQQQQQQQTTKNCYQTMFRQPALVSNALLSHGKASRETEA